MPLKPVSGLMIYYKFIIRVALFYKTLIFLGKVLLFELTRKAILNQKVKSLTKHIAIIIQTTWE